MSLVLSSLVLGVVSMSSAVDVVRQEDLSLAEAIAQGEFGGSLRARYEDVSLSGDKDAQAPTLALRAFYESERYQFFSAQFEYTSISSISGDENYFDGSNGENDDALVADPERSFFSRYSVAYDISNTVLRYGRQNLVLDNGRFIGTETHRQGESQVRGVTLFNESLDFLELNAGHLTRFDSAFGKTLPETSPDIRANYFNARYSGFMHSDLSFYSYSIDSLGESDLWDTQTDGVRFSGEIESDFSLSYAFELARQKDSGDNPVAYSTRYSLVELGIGNPEIRVFVGKESLGAEGAGLFVTPLAALHNFQGGADVFANSGLGNIDGGIADKYARLAGTIGGFDLDLAYHRYEPDQGVSRGHVLGEEWNAGVSYKWAYAEIAARFADYHARGYGLDTRKSWLDISAAF
jgi:hypothetical protein